ncbi:putative DNA-binding domain-containing protein [Dongia sp.]|uniref:HvfC/BufC family peptide modification chaperone n=1 Tax=Dongia sp. TaxID=1977262 RepID=UPI0037501D8B
MLAELQRDFARAVRGDALAVPRLEIDATGLNPERRLAVYRNHHRISLAAALAANFPTVVKVIGEPAFEALALSFLAIDPPREPSLAAYGAGFPAFVESDPRSLGLVYLGDVARLDWAHNVADRVDDLPTFTAQHLAALDAERLVTLQLKPHPSLTLLPSLFPLLQIRDVAAGLAENASLDAGGVDLMIWRKAGVVTHVALERGPALFIRALAGGQVLAEAAQNLNPECLPEYLAELVLSDAFLAPQG